jgi:MoaA/NifB/PqqE/SkfB family radical SAM enzyme
MTTQTLQEDILAELRGLPSPHPAAGMEAYERERMRALASDPRRRANYDAYVRSNRRGPTVDYLPIKLDIENVSRCNFRCTMCIVADWPRGQRAADMSVADFKRLIDEQYGLLEIKLQGVGEPTMQRDDFFEMIRYARSKHIWVRTTTNASLLHLRDNYKKLIDSDVNEVQISIDGATKEVFEGIRVGSHFESVLRNCKLINAYSREQGVRRTKMWTVVQQGNRHQLAALVELAAELGFTSQVFSLELIGWGVDKWNEKNAQASAQHELRPETLKGLIERARALGVTLSFWNATDKYRTDKVEHLCPWPFERAFVSSDLRVVPCCMIGNPEVYQIGSKLEDGQGFTATWMSADFSEFRQAHLDGRIPQVCRGCYHHGTTPNR